MLVTQKSALSTIDNICDMRSITKEKDSCASGFKSCISMHCVNISNMPQMMRIEL